MSPQKAFIEPDWFSTVKTSLAHAGQPVAGLQWHSLQTQGDQSYGNLVAKTRTHFIKVGPACNMPRFEAEMMSLQAIEATQTIRCPKVIVCESNAHHAWLVTEFLSLQPTSEIGQKRLGEQLAALHHQHDYAWYGWHADNWLGQSLQMNQQSQSWLEFWKTQRFTPQLQKAQDNQIAQVVIETAQKLHPYLATLLPQSPQSSLLHGDLWAGNVGQIEQDVAVVYDPACYVGDSEADMAMTELFGGFSQAFYDAYWHHRAPSPEYQTRKQLYNLYHILNHFNLFGGAFASKALTTMRSLLQTVT